MNGAPVSGGGGLPAEIRIRPSRGWAALNSRELWESRELLYFLVWRDIKVRYRQTVLGALWAILQPLLSMIVFTFFFGRLAGVGSDGAPYPLFSYAALLPWTLFAQGVTQASNSLVQAADVVRKVYFPRLLVPLSAVLAGVVDFVAALLVLAVLYPLYGVSIPATALLLPGIAAVCLLAAAGFGTLLSALNVEYRDVRHAVPFAVQLGLFVTPVIYPASAVCAGLERHGVPGWLYGLNPMVGVVEGFRFALLGTRSAPVGALLLVGAIVSILVFLAGLSYFRRVERTFADVV